MITVTLDTQRKKVYVAHIEPIRIKESSVVESEPRGGLVSNSDFTRKRSEKRMYTLTLKLSFDEDSLERVRGLLLGGVL